MKEKGCDPVEMAETQGCPCPTGMSEKFVQPCLLLLLAQSSSYGYSLVEGLSQFGLSYEPSIVYRNLRQMEKEGYLVSKWDTEGSGPARRYYQITPEGEEYLRSWTVTIRQNKQRLERFLKLYKEAFRPGREETTCVPCRVGVSCCDEPLLQVEGPEKEKEKQSTT